MSEENLGNPDSNPGSSDATPTSIINTPEPNVAAPQSFPDDWRQQFAGDDEKYLKQLERFGSPNDLSNSYREAQKKISSQKPTFEKPGEESTPEEVAAYRESLGIPESAADYNLDFEDGTVIGEDVRPMLDGFLEHAHNSNLPPEVVKDTVGFYLKDLESQQESLHAANEEARIEGTAELRAEWGGEFTGNMNAIQSLFTSAPEGTMDGLLGSAGPDGLKFANNPDNIRWLAGLAKQLNPSSTLVPPGPDQAASIDAEIEKIQSIMTSPDKSERDKYWSDDKMQARFAKLNQAKQR